MRATHRAWRLSALLLLVLIVCMAGPLHVLAAHGGRDADHQHATCGVCFTLSGAENAPVCAAPSADGDDGPAALPADEAPPSPVSPRLCDPTRAPPSLLA